MVGVAAAGWLVLTRPAEPGRLWLILLAVAAGVAGWRALAGAPPKAPPLFGEDLTPVRSGDYGLMAVELEVAGAIDPRLGGDRRLQRRLLAIANHRVRQERANDEHLRQRLGESAWEYLTGPEKPIELSELDDLIERIEAL